MKLRLHVIAELNISDHELQNNYAEPTPECVLRTEEENLEQESVWNYIHIFGDNDVVTKLEVISGGSTSGSAPSGSASAGTTGVH